MRSGRKNRTLKNKFNEKKLREKKRTMVWVLKIEECYVKGCAFECNKPRAIAKNRLEKREGRK